MQGGAGGGGGTWSCLNLKHQALLTTHGTPYPLKGVDGEVAEGKARWEARGVEGITVVGVQSEILKNLKKKK